MPVHPTTSEQKLGEHAPLLEAREGTAPWRQWGPYLSERQWGTVREDYSEHGHAWDYFPHDHARSRAYRWGEDGLAGRSAASTIAYRDPLRRAFGWPRLGPPQNFHRRASCTLECIIFYCTMQCTDS
jgi:hypothetical protein